MENLSQESKTDTDITLTNNVWVYHDQNVYWEMAYHDQMYCGYLLKTLALVHKHVSVTVINSFHFHVGYSNQMSCSYKNGHS